MIRFSCKNCGRLISVDEKHAGKKGKCPKCGGIVTVPERSTVIVFTCESCGHKIKVPDRYGGKKGKCPKCHEAVVIPFVEKDQVTAQELTSITCQMCGQTVEAPKNASEALIVCPSCGSYVETSSGSIPAASTESGDSVPPTTDDEPYQEPAGVDRRLIIIMSAVAAVVVVGLVILVAALKLARPRPQLQRQATDTVGSQTETGLEEAKAFTERYIRLLENGEVDEAFRLHSPELAKDVYRFSFEKLSKQIGSSRIIEMNCTQTQRELHPEGERVLLWYDLRCEEGTQTVNVSVLSIEKDFRVDGITVRDSRGSSFSIGLRDSGVPSQSGRTAGRRRASSSSGKFFFAIFVGFAIGTLFSAGCLWVGMKVTKVEGTFAALIGIAAISSLAGIIPLFVGLFPCVGWLFSLIVMFVLICKWTDAEFWPDAIGIVLISGVVGILARALLGFIISMA